MVIPGGHGNGHTIEDYNGTRVAQDERKYDNERELVIVDYYLLRWTFSLGREVPYVVDHRRLIVSTFANLIFAIDRSKIISVNGLHEYAQINLCNTIELRL